MSKPRISEVISTYYRQSLKTTGLLLIGAASLKAASTGVQFKNQNNTNYYGLGNAYLGFASDSSTIEGVLSDKTATIFLGSLSVGYTGNAHLHLEDDARLNVNWDLTVGDRAFGKLTVDDSDLFVLHNALIGKDGFGILSITGTSDAWITNTLYLGYRDTAAGILLVKGPQADLYVGNNLVIGQEGVGSAKVSWGGNLSVFDDIILADAIDSLGSLTVSGPWSEVNAGDDLIVGNYGAGFLTINWGAEVNVGDNMVIGQQIVSLGVVNISKGGELDVDGNLVIADLGLAFVNVNKGGDLQVGENLVIGQSKFSFGTLNLTGRGTDAVVGENLVIGSSGVGSVNVNWGADLTVYDNLVLGEERSGVGFLTITGYSSDVTVYDNLIIGESGHGFVLVNHGADLTVYEDLILGENRHGQGSLVATGHGTDTEVKQDLIVGDNGHGYIDLSYGAELVVKDNLVLGDGFRGRGTLTASGWGTEIDVKDNLIIGNKGKGSVILSKGAELTVDEDLVLGQNRSGKGSLFASGKGTDIKVKDDLVIGDKGEGFVSLSKGADLEVKEDLVLGKDYSGEGILFASDKGTDIKVKEDLTIGEKGKGLVVLSKGANLEVKDNVVLGEKSSGKGTLIASGYGTDIEIDENLIIGEKGEGLVILNKGVQLEVGEDISLGEYASGKGTLIASGYGTDIKLDEDLIIGKSGEGLVILSKGADLEVGDDVVLGANDSGEGALIASGWGTDIDIDGTLTIGWGGKGFVFLNDGADLNVTETVVIGRYGDNSQGALIASGHNTDINVGGDFYIGVDGQGFTLIKDGADLSVKGDLVLGDEAGFKGALVASGWGTDIKVKGKLTIGEDGEGLVVIKDGADLFVKDDVVLGRDSTGKGALIASGNHTDLTFKDNLVIGESGKGSVDIRDGADLTVRDNVVLGKNEGSEGELSASGNKTDIKIQDHLIIGKEGSGAVQISDGADLKVKDSVILAAKSGSQGSLSISGHRTDAKIGDHLIVGGNGSEAYVTVSSGADLSVGRHLVAGVGSSNVGYVTVKGNASDLFVKGNTAVGVKGQGYLQVLDGGNAFVKGDVVAGLFSGSDGNIIVSGEGSKLIAKDDFYAGIGGQGTLLVDHQGKVVIKDEAGFGLGEGSYGYLSVENESLLVVGESLTLGSEGHADAYIGKGAVAKIGNDLNLGQSSNGSAILTIYNPNSKVFVGDDLDVGEYGKGELNVYDGAYLKVGEDLHVAHEDGSKGTVRLDGAGTKVSVAERLNVGYHGDGTLQVTNGAKISADLLQAGMDEGSKGSISLSGKGSVARVREAKIGQGGTVTIDIANAADLLVKEDFTVFGSNSQPVRINIHGSNSSLQVGGQTNLGYGDSSNVVVTVSKGALLDSQGDINLGHFELNQSKKLHLSSEGKRSVVKSQQSINVYSGKLETVGGGTIAVGEGYGINLYGNSQLIVGSLWDSKGETFGYLDTASIVGYETKGANGLSEVKFAHNGTLENPYYFTYNSTGQDPENGPIMMMVARGSDDLASDSLASTRDGASITMEGAIKLNQAKGVSVITGDQYHTGGTEINGGRLITESSKALADGKVTLNTGVLELRKDLNISELDWQDGFVHLTPGKSGTLNVAKKVTDLGHGGAFIISYDQLDQTTYELVNFDSTNLTLDSLTAYFEHPTNEVAYHHTFELTDSQILLTITGATAWGNILDNRGPSYIPTYADYIVGDGSYTGPNGADNYVNSLIFEDQSSLELFGRLFVTSGLFNVKGDAVVKGNVIEVQGNFLQDGGGALNYLSDLLVNGNATFKDGRAYINGELVADLTIIENSFTLGGSGIVNSDVIVKGRLAPGNSPGTLTINGDLTLASSADVDIEIASHSWFDKILVSGTARLNGDLNVTNFGGNKLEIGDKYTFLEADRVRGEFDEINVAQGNVRGRVRYEDDEVTLYIAADKYSDVAKGTNQRNIARALNRWIGVESGSIGEATWLLDTMTVDQLRHTFDALAPTYVEAVLNSAVELSQSHGDLLHQQLSARRLAKPAAVAEAQGDKNAKNVQAPEVAPAASTQWNAWTQVSGMFSEGGISLNPSESFESGTILLGADYALSESVSVGIFASYQESWSDYGSNDSVDSNAVRFGFYGTLDLGGFYANVAAGYGRLDYDMDRQIRFSGFKKSANGSVDGDEFFGLIGAGYDLKVNKFTFGPQVSLQYSHIDLDSFRESGGGVFGLSVSDAETESLRSQVGARVAYEWEVKEGLSIIPEVRAFWQHEFLDGGESFHARFNGGRGAGFNYQTQSRDKDALFIGAGIGVKVSDRFYGNVYYNTDFGREESNHTVSVSATFKF